MTDEYRIMLVDGNSPAIEGELITGLAMHTVYPWPETTKAIIQRKVGNVWEDVQLMRHIPLVWKHVVGEIDDGVVYTMVDGEPSYWVKGKGWREYDRP